MAKRIFKIGDKYINLALLATFEVLPGWKHGDEAEDEYWDRLQVQCLGNTWLTVGKSDLPKSGFESIEAIVEGLRSAMDALD